MTPEALRTALAARGGPWPADDAELLAAVEARADAAPTDPTWTPLVLAADLLHRAPTQLPVDLLRGRLVRVDALSATWTARNADGERFLVRVARPGLSPVQRRMLKRDARALEGLVPGLTVADGCLLAPLPGAALEGPLPDAHALRFVATLLAEHHRWARTGITPPSPTPFELRESEGRAIWVSLTPAPPNLTPVLRHVAYVLRPGGWLASCVRSMIDLPPPDAIEAGQRLQSAMAEALLQTTIELQQSQLLHGHTRRRERLAWAVQKLRQSLPPPEGDSPIGFDLEGRPTQVTSDARSITWGSAPRATVWSEGTFDAPEARRLLRACAIAPSLEPHPHREAVGRWVAAGLRLRTLHMLLERT